MTGVVSREPVELDVAELLAELRELYASTSSPEARQALRDRIHDLEGQASPETHRPRPSSHGALLRLREEDPPRAPRRRPWPDAWREVASISTAEVLGLRSVHHD